MVRKDLVLCSMELHTPFSASTPKIEMLCGCVDTAVVFDSLKIIFHTHILNRELLLLFFSVVSFLAERLFLID